MLEPATGIPLLAHQSHHVGTQAHRLTRAQHSVQKRALGDDGAGSGILELEGQFLGRIRGVCGTDDTAGPKRAESYGGRVDAVRAEEEEDLALSPGPVGFEALAEGECGLTERVVGVMAVRTGVFVYYYVEGDVLD